MGGPAVFSNACEQGAGCDEVKSLFIHTCLIWGRKTFQNKLLECHKGVCCRLSTPRSPHICYSVRCGADSVQGWAVWPAGSDYFRGAVPCVDMC